MSKRTVTIYVRPGSWSAYVVSEDQYCKIAVPVTPETMDPEIYAAGYEAYRDGFLADGAEVSVVFRDGATDPQGVLS